MFSPFPSKLNCEVLYLCVHRQRCIESMDDTVVESYIRRRKEAQYKVLITYINYTSKTADRNSLYFADKLFLAYSEYLFTKISI